MSNKSLPLSFIPLTVLNFLLVSNHICSSFIRELTTKPAKYVNSYRTSYYLFSPRKAFLLKFLLQFLLQFVLQFVLHECFLIYFWHVEDRTFLVRHWRFINFKFLSRLPYYISPAGYTDKTKHGRVFRYLDMLCVTLIESRMRKKHDKYSNLIYRFSYTIGYYLFYSIIRLPSCWLDGHILYLSCSDHGSCVTRKIGLCFKAPSHSFLLANLFHRYLILKDR